MRRKQSFTELFSEKNPQQRTVKQNKASKATTISEDQTSSKTNGQPNPTKVCIDNKSQILKVFDGTHSPLIISFREQQDKEIRQFIQQSIDEKLKCRCLLLTGMPGAGKTLTSRRILGQTEGIKTIFVNGNAFKNFVDDLSQKLVGAKLPLHQLIDKLKSQKSKQRIFLFVDEFDSLFAGETAEFLNIFQLFSHPIKHLSLIGTSNSMQIMQNLTLKYKLSLPEIKNIVFSPYTAQQIRKIILCRINQIKQTYGFTINFQQIALKYCAGKLANSKRGDIRGVLQQIKRIISLALEDCGDKKICSVKFEHASAILVALNKSFQGGDLMRSLPFQQSVALIAVYLIYQREQCLQIPIKKLQQQTSKLQKILHLQSQSTKMDQLILSYLQVYGFISIRTKKKQLQVCLKSNLQTIKNAFQDDDLLGRFFWQ